MIDRIRAGVVTAGLCLAVLSPIVPDEKGRLHDDYPLSWYPMFRGVRPARETVLWMRATLADGSTRHVQVAYWTPGGITEGRAHLERAVKTNTTVGFCSSLAGKLAERKTGWASRVTELAVVRSTWVLSEYYADPDPKPVGERVLATCVVTR